MHKAKDALSSWPELNARLAKLPEEELKRLLGRELRGKRRVHFLLRLHGRYNKLRAERERRELIGGKPQ